MKKRVFALLLAMAVGINLTACAGNMTETTVSNNDMDNDTEIDAVTKAEEDKHFVDNDLLYVNDDDTSVITMYLTVSKGTSSNS